MEILSALIGAIIGSLVSAILTSYYARKEQKQETQVQTTITLYQEFQSADMLTSRIKAERVLFENRKQNKPLSYSELYHQLYSEHREEDWFHVSRMLHFFEHISILYKANYLDEHLVKVSLASYFDFWYSQFFKMLGQISEEKDEDSEWTAPINYLATQLINR